MSEKDHSVTPLDHSAESSLLSKEKGSSSSAYTLSKGFSVDEDLPLVTKSPYESESIGLMETIPLNYSPHESLIGHFHIESDKDLPFAIGNSQHLLGENLNLNTKTSGTTITTNIEIKDLEKDPKKHESIPENPHNSTIHFCYNDEKREAYDLIYGKIYLLNMTLLCFVFVLSFFVSLPKNDDLAFVMLYYWGFMRILIPLVLFYYVLLYCMVYSSEVIIWSCVFFLPLFTFLFSFYSFLSFFHSSLSFSHERSLTTLSTLLYLGWVSANLFLSLSCLYYLKYHRKTMEKQIRLTVKLLYFYRHFLHDKKSILSIFLASMILVFIYLVLFALTMYLFPLLFYGGVIWLAWGLFLFGLNSVLILNIQRWIMSCMIFKHYLKGKEQAAASSFVPLDTQQGDFLSSFLSYLDTKELKQVCPLLKVHFGSLCLCSLIMFGLYTTKALILIPKGVFCILSPIPILRLYPRLSILRFLSTDYWMNLNRLGLYYLAIHGQASLRASSSKMKNLLAQQNKINLFFLFSLLSVLKYPLWLITLWMGWGLYDGNHIGMVLLYMIVTGATLNVIGRILFEGIEIIFCIFIIDLSNPLSIQHPLFKSLLQETL